MPEVKVLDSHMAYADAGEGAVPVVFLHGNPSSSYMWRNVIPHVSGQARCLAPDLIGMGGSGKPEIAYRFADHARYLDAWFDRMGLREVVLVGHDWGGALAFDWAARHPDRVRGVAFFEAIIRPMSWSELGEGPRARSEAIRGPQGESLVLDQDYLVRTAFTGGVLHPLSEEELQPYLAPFPTRESRRPILQWARSIPLDGEPADVAERIEKYDAWLAASTDVPKLLLTFDSSPTLLIVGGMAEWCAANVAALETEYGGPAGHHAAVDQPERIGAAVAAWLARHRLLDPVAAL